MLETPTNGAMRIELFNHQLNEKRQVKLKTCADVYDYWRSYKRLYKKAPKDGVEFQLEYIDTGLSLSEEARAKAPIALALHGAPGSYQDFALLIRHLSQQKVRVIAPNFPEYIATVRTGVLFRHSADEKAAYLRDFLKAIDVNKIDLLISHSSAIFPTLLILLNANCQAIAKHRAQQKERDRNDQLQQQQLQLMPINKTNSENTKDVDDNNNKGAEALGKVDMEVNKERLDPRSGRRSTRGVRHRKSRQEVIVQFEQPIEIKAVALFNPAGHRMPKSMKPAWFKCNAVHAYQHKLGRSLFRKLGPAFLTVVGVPVKVDNMDNVMLSATVMRNSRCQRVISQLEQLSEMKIPTLLVFSENDKLIEKEIFYEMTRFMRLDSNSFDLVNNEGDIEQARSDASDWIRVMVFKAGGHYAYSNYAKTVNKAVSELLEKVTTGHQQQNSTLVEHNKILDEKTNQANGNLATGLQLSQ